MQNASLIIVIGKAGLLEKISPIADKWLIPEGVFQEISQKGSISQYIKELSTTSEVQILPVLKIDPVVTSWNLGRGESEVLTLTKS